MGKHVMIMMPMGAVAKLHFETQDALTLGANPMVVRDIFLPLTINESIKCHYI